MDIMRLEIIVTVSNWLGQSTSGNASTWIQLDQAGSFHVPRPRAGAPNCEPRLPVSTVSNLFAAPSSLPGAAGSASGCQKLADLQSGRGRAGSSDEDAQAMLFETYFLGAGVCTHIVQKWGSMQKEGKGRKSRVCASLDGDL